MQKNLVIIMFILFIIFFIVPKQGVSEPVMYEDTYQVIPDEAIRLRILANSDSEKDQQLKRMVRDAVNEHITTWVEHLTDIEDARTLIKARMPQIERIVGNALAAEGSEQAYSVEYGSNITFPTKLYDTYVYPAGEYEAILITIGEGLGSNWWCVLFPPLCFLDFSSGSTVAAADESTVDDVEDKDDIDEEEEEESVKVKFFLFEWLGWT